MFLQCSKTFFHMEILLFHNAAKPAIAPPVPETLIQPRRRAMGALKPKSLAPKRGVRLPVPIAAGGSSPNPRR
jgi:hypothetical protein